MHFSLNIAEGKLDLLKEFPLVEVNLPASFVSLPDGSILTFGCDSPRKL